jgi:hypothetical protein
MRHECAQTQGVCRSNRILRQETLEGLIPDSRGRKAFMPTQSGGLGPIEDKALPSRLRAHVITNEPAPRVHGYDVQRDLACHYRLTDMLHLALTGDLPDEATARALDVVLAFVAPVSAAEASTHAAVVARVCGPRVASVVAVAAIALAEQARTLLDEHEHILPRLAIGSLNGSAAAFAPRSDDDRAAVERLRTALGPFRARVPAIGYDIRLDTAIIATLMACGLRSREQLEVAIATARLPLACAEALAWKPGDLRAYPMDLPRFVYEGAPHGQ